MHLYRFLLFFLSKIDLPQNQLNQTTLKVKLCLSIFVGVSIKHQDEHLVARTRHVSLNRGLSGCPPSMQSINECWKLDDPVESEESGENVMPRSWLVASVSQFHMLFSTYIVIS